ncbi:barrier-to-autointegration factor-like [Sebastes fasciatus]|uniref:barrier-to-autointegration factor-like n=1 Tax=Sebastes fasciatus TaxID=394691 RepID=UPI003D9F5554
MSTSLKHRLFVGEPMGNKSVTSLPGIGKILGKKLEQQGFDKAYVVLGQFLTLKKDREMFTDWLKDASGANARQARHCDQCLRDYCDAFTRDPASSCSSRAPHFLHLKLQSQLITLLALKHFSRLHASSL